MNWNLWSRWIIRKRIKPLAGFTLVELLITLVLTAILLNVTYLCIDYSQRFFKESGTQNRFIAQFSYLKGRLRQEAKHASYIIETAENQYVFYNDSIQTNVKITESGIVVIQKSEADTFVCKTNGTKAVYNRLNEPVLGGRLVDKLELPIRFQKQNYHITVSKNYTTYSLLKLKM